MEGRNINPQYLQEIRPEGDLTNANLTGADLSTLNLTGANLTRANLTGATIDIDTRIDQIHTETFNTQFNRGRRTASIDDIRNFLLDLGAVEEAHTLFEDEDEDEPVYPGLNTAAPPAGGKRIKHKRKTRRNKKKKSRHYKMRQSPRHKRKTYKRH